MLNVTFSPAPATLPSGFISFTVYCEAFLKYLVRSLFSVIVGSIVMLFDAFSPVLGFVAVRMYVPCCRFRFSFAVPASFVVLS